jgi:ferric-dicitrate binding protein FerR (iron transport regulator)
MKKDDHIWELLIAYFSNNINDADKAFIETWARNEVNAQLFADARKIWESSNARLQYKADSGKQLLALRERIRRHERPGARIISLMRRQRGYVIGIAATVCVLIVSYFIIQRPAVSDDILIESKGEVVTVYLPDSSKVWLNQNSRISYAKDFTNRNVQLNGEAFFSVRKDTTPFVIHTTRSKTEVLGTAFNLDDDGDSAVTLTVARGKVNFSKITPADPDSVIVNASETAVLYEHQVIRKSRTASPDVARWRQVNNPSFEQERTQPANYLVNRFSWRKNAINQSVIEGSLTNTASLAGYYRIVLEATYTRPDGRQVKAEHVITETVYPGRRIVYRKRILDILKDTKAVTVQVKSAQVTTTSSF